VSGGDNDLTDSLIMKHKQRIREGVKSTGGSARNATECVATVQQGEDQGGGQGFDGLSLFTIGSRKVFIYNRTSKSLWIKIFFPPELAIVPFRLMFLKLQKKKNHDRKKCAPYGPHTPVGRGFSEEYEEMGGVFCRGLFYQMSASYLILGRKRF
jgi:hypothetical protein